MFWSFSASTWSLAALAFGSSLLLTAAVRRLAAGIGLVDSPDGGRKAHARPTPLMGGVAFFLSILLTLLAARLSGTPLGPIEAETLGRIRMLLLSAGMFCLIGLIDDVRSLRPRGKLLLQMAAAMPFALWGRPVESVELLGTGIELQWASIPFTVFWLVACANIINLVDGLDGLAGTIGVIVCLTAAVLAHMAGQPAVCGLGLVVAGSLLGFLWHNWPPAKIFLGDSGSLPLGFLVGALAIESSMKTATSLALAVPLVLISVPVFDTLMAILRRKLTGRGIGEADRQHIHHCLQDRGLTRRQALLAISGLCLSMAAVTVVAAFLQNDWLALGMCCALLGMLIVGRVFGDNETLLLVRYLRATSLALVGSSTALRFRRPQHNAEPDQPAQPLQIVAPDEESGDEADETYRRAA